MSISTFQLSSGAAANVYSSTGNTAITSLTFCNYSAANIAVNMFVVPSGGSAGNSTVVLANLIIQGGDTYQIYQAAEKLLLGNGDTIQANANVNSTITAVTSYTTI